MAVLLLIGGLACVVVAVFGLAGAWWALLAAGLLLAAGGVLTAVADGARARAAVQAPGRRLRRVPAEGEAAA